MAGLVVIAIAFLVVLGGSFLRPDPTPKANDQYLPLAFKKPGFSVPMLSITKNSVVEKQGFWSRWINGQEKEEFEMPVYDLRIDGEFVEVELYTGYEKNNGAIERYHLADVLYPLERVERIEREDGVYIRSYLLNGNVIEEPLTVLQKIVQKKRLEERIFILGTDKYGRDLLSRLMSGTVISFSVGFISVGISVFLGILLGAIAAYYRGWADQLIMWFINVVWSIPTLLLVIAITLVLGKGYWQVFVAVGLTMWVEVARVVRGQVLGIREKEFVEAARVLGYGDGRIILRHILPNVMSPVIVISAANFASAILIEAGLSFLGLGAQPPQATWGRMISEHKGYIITGDAYLALIPGLAIMLMVLAFMLIGNGLRDAMDTRSALTPGG